MPLLIFFIIGRFIIVPSSLFRSTPVSSASSKTIFVCTFIAFLFIASSWNLLSFSKLSIHIGDVHHSSSSDVASTNSDSATTATNAPSSSSTSVMSSEQAMQTTGAAVAKSPSSGIADSPISKIEAGIREIASTGFDPFSVSLVNPKMEIKKSDIEKLSPFYQLLITQNKDIKLIVPPPPKPKVDVTEFNPAGGGVAIEAIPLVPNPIEGIKLSGISYMPKRSFAMLNVSGQAHAAIVSQGEVIDVAGQQVKVVSIARGAVSLCWLGAPKGITPTQKLTMPDIIGYKPASNSGSSSSAPSAPGATGGAPAGASMPMGGASGSKSMTPPPPNNTPEAIEKLVNAAMKP
jgi:hypothetical protein